MSLWWVNRDQLDVSQVKLIEELPLQQSHLVLGPPGSGKTNVLLRRAQFVRSQRLPNVMVLTFTRPLAEFVRTGCFDANDREIFPPNCVTTIESWIRHMYKEHGADLPNEGLQFAKRKARLAQGALQFVPGDRLPKYDSLFIDEAQDLTALEVDLFTKWSDVLFFTGDDRQKIHGPTEGLDAVRALVPKPEEKNLQFHYRLAPELCAVADRIMAAQGGANLSTTCHYNGPKPGRIDFLGPLTSDRILELAASKLKDQVRVYNELIQQGDRLGIIVARREDREQVFEYLESIPELQGKSKIIRARSDDGGDRNYNPAFEMNKPICIVTVQGCKGIEFRAAHWLFCEELKQFHNAEHYYTVVTRAKTSLDVYYEKQLPQQLARAHAKQSGSIW